MPFSTTNLEKSELEVILKNQAIYLQDAPSYIPTERNSSRTYRSLLEDSLESSRLKVKFKLSPLKFIIPENKPTVVERSLDNYFDSKKDLFE